jgi:chromate transport protein ChrA
MDDALRRRLDAALALLAVIAFATLSVAFSPATAVALALVSGLLGALLRMEWSVPTPEE